MDAPALYPGLQVLAGIAVKVPEVKLRAVLDVIHVGERGASQSNILLNNDTDYTLPAYTRMDLTLSSLGLHLMSGESETRVLARVRNVSDEKWSEPGFGGFDIPQLGRTMQFEVRQAF